MEYKVRMLEAVLLLSCSVFTTDVCLTMYMEAVRYIYGCLKLHLVVEYRVMKPNVTGKY